MLLVHRFSLASDSQAGGLVQEADRYVNAVALTQIPSPNIDEHNRFSNSPTSLDRRANHNHHRHRHQHCMLKVIPRLFKPSADANFTLPKHLFLLRLPIHLHTLHLTNSSFFKELLHPLELGYCPPNRISNCLRHQHLVAAMKLNPNQFPDAKVNLPKRLFLLLTHLLHLINRHLKQLLQPLKHCPPNHISRRLRHQHCVAALSRMVISRLHQTRS